MDALSWLTQHRFQSIARRDYDRVLVFDHEATIVVHCLWRLLENGRIRVSGEDDGHQFGLLAPVDAGHEVTTRLEGASIRTVEVREGVSDLRLHFSSGHVFEIIPDSLGYEAWDAANATDRFIGNGSRVSVLHGYQKA